MVDKRYNEIIGRKTRKLYIFIVVRTGPTDDYLFNGLRSISRSSKVPIMGLL